MRLAFHSDTTYMLTTAATVASRVELQRNDILWHLYLNVIISQCFFFHRTFAGVCLLRSVYGSSVAKVLEFCAQCVCSKLCELFAEAEIIQKIPFIW